MANTTRMHGCKGSKFMSGKGREGAASTMLDGNTNPPYDEYYAMNRWA
jgi:hypothetical protein